MPANTRLGLISCKACWSSPRRANASTRWLLARTSASVSSSTRRFFPIRLLISRMRFFLPQLLSSQWGLNSDDLCPLFRKQPAHRRTGGKMRQLYNSHSFEGADFRLPQLAVAGGSTLLDIDDAALRGRFTLRMGKPFLRAAHHPKWKVQQRDFVLDLLSRFLLNRRLNRLYRAGAVKIT